MKSLIEEVASVFGNQYACYGPFHKSVRNTIYHTNHNEYMPTLTFDVIQRDLWTRLQQQIESAIQELLERELGET